MATVPLDLNEHDPEDYYGKTVMWQGVDFVVGRHIVTGGDSIVHRLVNQSTGEYGFVIKVRRHPEPERALTQPSDGEFHLHSKHILVDAVVDLPGGQISIQPLVQADVPGPPGKSEKMGEANRLYKEKRLDEALAIYQELHRELPGDLEVTFNLGAMLAQQGDAAEAYEQFASIVQADPLDLESRVAWFRCAAICGPLDLAEMALFNSISTFPMDEQIRRLGIDMYLGAGQPEMAVRLIAPLPGLFRTRYTEVIEDFDRKAIAWRGLRSLQDAASGAEWFRSVQPEQVQAAVDAYPKDPLLSMNLAFALRRAGRYAEAIEVLRGSVRSLRAREMRACITNTGFCEILAGRHEDAERSFDVALQLYASQAENGQLDPADIANIGEWVEEIPHSGGLTAWVEEKPAAGLALLQQLGPAPPGSSRELLARLYAHLTRR